MNQSDLKFLSKARRLGYLLIFIVGSMLTFTSTDYMIKTVVFDNFAGASSAADRRVVFLLISLFGFISYFIETIFEKSNKEY